MKEQEIIKYIKDEIEDEIDTYHWFDDTPKNKTRLQIEESINAHQGLLDLYTNAKTEINKLNNVIDRMAEVLNNQDIDYLRLCDNCKNSNEECHGDYCEERIKEYFMEDKEND